MRSSKHLAVSDRPGARRKREFRLRASRRRSERGGRCRSRRVGSRIVIEPWRRRVLRAVSVPAPAPTPGQSTSIPAPSGSTQSTTSGQTVPGTTTGQNTPNTPPSAGMPRGRAAAQARPSAAPAPPRAPAAPPAPRLPAAAIPPAPRRSSTIPSVGTGQTTTQNQLKANPMAVPNTGGVGTGC